MNVFGTVKTSINTREAVEHYGIEVNRYGNSARFTMTDIRVWLCTMTTTIVSLAENMET